MPGLNTTGGPIGFDMDILRFLKHNVSSGPNRSQNAGKNQYTAGDATIVEYARPRGGALSRKLPYLIIYTDNDGWTRYRIDGKGLTLGRSAAADITIKDERVSSIHCTVEHDAGVVTLVDMDSTNGTYIDGRQIQREKVTSKSTLQIGRTVMKLEYKDDSDIRFENEIIRKATIDPLTGVFNRDFFMGRANEEIAFSKRTNAPIGLIMLDVDFFKAVNDTHGHRAGDHILILLANLINEQKRVEDILGRYGGEEFIMIVRGALDRDSALLFCERIRSVVEQYPFEFDGKTIPLTISIGLCLEYTKNIESLDDLINRADNALYRAKKNGRNRVEANP